MKRIICVFILLALILLLTPCYGETPAPMYGETPAAEGGAENDISLLVFGTRVTSDNQDDVFGDGTVSFNPETNVLTLNEPHVEGYSIDTSHNRYKIYAKGFPLTILGSYHMTETEVDVEDIAFGLNVTNGSLTLDGSFTFRGKKRGIQAGQGLTVSGGRVSALGGSNTGAFVVHGDLTLEAGSFEAVSDDRGVTINEGKLIICADVESAYFQGEGYAAVVAIHGFSFPSSSVRKVRLASPGRAYIGYQTIYDPDYFPPGSGPVHVHVSGAPDEAARKAQFVSDKLLGVTLGDVDVTDANAGDILGNGTASYDPITRTLTLNEPDVSSSVTRNIDGTDASYTILATDIDQLTVKGKWHMSEPRADYGIRAVDGSLVFDGSFAFKGNIVGACASDEIIARSGGLYAYGGEIGAVADKLTLESNCGYVELESGMKEPGMFDSMPEWPDEYRITTELTSFRNDQPVDTGHYQANDKYVVRQLDMTGFMIGDKFLTVDKIRITEITGFEGAGSENDPYLIANEEDWNRLAALVEEDSNNRLSGRHFGLANDVTVTTMIGSSEHPFNGFFNGCGHLLTFNYTTNEANCAPFRYVGSATIENMRIGGTINTSKKFAAGLVSDVKGSCRIINCLYSGRIESSVSGDGTHGGFVATGSNVSITGCTYMGTITGENTTLCAGFLAWDYGGSSVSYCVYNGYMNTESGSANFIRNTSKADHCYYAHTIGQGRDFGKKAYAISSTLTSLVINLGSGVEYDVSSITAYPEGIKWSNRFRAGEGDQISMRFTYANLPTGNRIVGQYASPGELTEAEDGVWTLTMPDDNVTIYPILIPDSGTGAEEDPYRIETAEMWNLFSEAIKKGFSTSGKYFVLMNHISVTEMMGTQENRFAGIFDGQGKTLSFNAENKDSNKPVAPFAWTSGATIRNLHVTGAVTGSMGRASGLIGENKDAVSQVINCRVSMSVSGTYYTAGFLIGEGAGVHFTGCVFDGSILSSSSNSAGFAGWSERSSGLRFTDCLVAPSTFTGGNAFYYDNYQSGTQVLTNSYSLATTGNVQGKQAFSVTADEGVMIDFGTPVKTYNVSGLTAYATGLWYNEVFYAGKDDTVAISLQTEEPEGTIMYGIDCGAGILAENENACTLTMPEGKVVIRLLLAPVFDSPDFTLPADLTEIGEEAFQGAKMNVALIPEQVTFIGSHAFRNCESLTQIRIPAGCGLGTDVFDGCGQVFVYGSVGSEAEAYCSDPEHSNCIFIQE